MPDGQVGQNVEARIWNGSQGRSGQGSGSGSMAKLDLRGWAWEALDQFEIQISFIQVWEPIFWAS